MSLPNFLSDEQIFELQNLLQQGCRLFKALDPQSRQNEFIAAGFLDIADLVSYSGTNLDFFMRVWVILITKSIERNAVRTPALISLLRYLVHVEYNKDKDLGDEFGRKTLFEATLEQYKTWLAQQQSANGGIRAEVTSTIQLTQQQADIGTLLDQRLTQRASQISIEKYQQIDLKIITGFDLDALEDAFLNKVTLSGVLGFSAGGYGDLSIMEEYIGPRMIEALRINRAVETRWWFIRLNEEDLKVAHSQVVERAILRTTGHGQLVEILDENPTNDILVFVLNRKVPTDDMKELAVTFWQDKVLDLLKLPDRMKRERRLFLIVWVNVVAAALEASCFIRLPDLEPFDPDHLRLWFDSRLRQVGLTPEAITDNIDRLIAQAGDPVDTYREMKRTYEMLKGGRT